MPLAVTFVTVFTPLEMVTVPDQTIPPASSFVFCNTYWKWAGRTACQTQACVAVTPGERAR